MNLLGFVLPSLMILTSLTTYSIKDSCEYERCECEQCKCTAEAHCGCFPNPNGLSVSNDDSSKSSCKCQ